MTVTEKMQDLLWEQKCDAACAAARRIQRGRTWLLEIFRLAEPSDIIYQKIFDAYNEIEKWEQWFHSIKLFVPGTKLKDYSALPPAPRSSADTLGAVAGSGNSPDRLEQRAYPKK